MGSVVLYIFYLYNVNVLNRTIYGKGKEKTGVWDLSKEAYCCNNQSPVDNSLNLFEENFNKMCAR